MTLNATTLNIFQHFCNDFFILCYKLISNMSKSEVEEDLKEKAASLVEYVSFLLEYLESYSQNPEVSDFLTLLTVL